MDPAKIYLIDAGRFAVTIMCMELWNPDLDVNESLVTRLIESQFPSLSPVQLEDFGSGWDNVVYRVNGQWLFRFPHRAVAAPDVEKEIECLPRMARWLSGIPMPHFLGKPSPPEYPWPFYGYQPVPGKEACDLSLDTAARQKLALPIAHLLRVLHSTPIRAELATFLKVDPLGRLDFPKRVTKTRELLSALEKRGFPADYAGLSEILEKVQHRERPEPISVVHGDLHFRHLLVTPEGALGGLIDWGDMHLNDPAVDLHLYWSFLPPEARGPFAAEYGEALTADRLEAARAFAVFINAILLDYGQRAGLVAVEREAALALKLVLLN